MYFGKLFVGKRVAFVNDGRYCNGIIYTILSLRLYCRMKEGAAEYGKDEYIIWLPAAAHALQITILTGFASQLIYVDRKPGSTAATA